MSKSFRNADNSFGAHLTAATQRQKNDVASEVAAALSERFEILETIVESESHVLYSVRDLGHPKRGAEDGADIVRLKILSGSAAGEDRQINLFHLEARAAARLSHENIIETAEVEEINGIHFSVIEHKPHVESLRDLLKREGWFELDRALDMIKQIANALDHAHGLGVLHLTLQPEKILVEPDGRVLVTGFGIESEKDLLWAHQERSHQCAAHYISPEQVQCRHIDQRSDLYSLGIVMFEMLTDRVPFDSTDSISIKLKHLNRLPEPPHMFRPELPKLLCWLVMDLLKKNPDERPADVETFKSVLEQCVASGLEVAEVINEPAASSDSHSLHADSEQEKVEAQHVPEPSIYLDHETERDSSTALTPDANADEEDAPEHRGLPLIISEDDTPADDADLFTEAEAQNYSGEIYLDPAPHEDRIAEAARYSGNYDAPPKAFAFESRMMPEAAQAESRPRSHRLAWLAAILLIAAACLVWALRAPRLQNSASVEQPVLATDSNGEGKSGEELKSEAASSEAPKFETLEPEASKPETLKPETSKATEISTESEAAISAQRDKLAAKNADKTADKREKEIEPVATRDLPQQAKPSRLMPPSVSTVPSASGAEGTASGVMGGDISGNTRTAEPPPPAQPPKREEPPAPKMIRRSGDVLQNSAISRIRPIYPEAARSAHVKGPVTVEVTVDEEGSVIAARAISGPDLLKDAAVNAARGWKWMPTRMDRTRVKVVGTITLNFQR
jgi:TonB family protein